MKGKLLFHIWDGKWIALGILLSDRRDYDSYFLEYSVDLFCLTAMETNNDYCIWEDHDVYIRNEDNTFEKF